MTRCASGLGIAPVDRDALGCAARRKSLAEILPYAAPVWKVLNEKRKAGKRILFEGAQGALLDIDFRHVPICDLFQCDRRAGGHWRGPWSRMPSIMCWVS